MALRRLPVLALLLAIAVAGCATDPPAGGGTPVVTTPAATPAITTPVTTTPAVSPPPGIWEGYIEVRLVAEPPNARAGEEIRLTLTAKNHRETSVWTNPGVSCGGSWDVTLRDASGNVLRIDDRDSLGCPTTDTYSTEIRPGEEESIVYTWDGMLRPSLGQTEPAPPGTYTATGIVRYATEAGASNGSGPYAAETNASVRIEITE